MPAVSARPASATDAEPLPTYVDAARPRTSRSSSTPAARPGSPKGALLTHLNLVMNATVERVRRATRSARDDVVMGCLPLFHTFGQTRRR